MKLYQHVLRALFILVPAAIVAGIVTWFWGEPIMALLTDEARIEALVEQAGPWGPLALIAINVVQIVIAPIPGYVVQLAAGYLYGPLWGGIYAAIGLIAGAMLTMALARIFGRPLARWVIGEQRLERWETVTHSDSAIIWFLMLLGPIGDIPYTLAGLSRVRYLTIFLITLFVRVPTAFLSTAIGGGLLPAYWLVALVAAAGALGLLLLRFRAPLTLWFDNLVAARTLGEPAPVLLPAPSEPASDESW